ncbi:hypothetical protein LJC10_06215, partial [Selenomonadales bacterium OttesenSCG-928-I06]|nr:hypothetical protein [Selenomonadales bacterium OttesenSCG-928-I06]
MKKRKSLNLALFIAILGMPLIANTSYAAEVDLKGAKTDTVELVSGNTYIATDDISISFTDTATIGKAGLVVSGNSLAVDLSNIDTIINCSLKGQTTAQNYAAGVKITGNTNTLNLKGVITASGSNTYGIYIANTSNNNVTFTGNINATESAGGVMVRGTNNEVTINGSIDSVVNGITVYGTSKVTHNGDITSALYGAHIYNDSNLVINGDILMTGSSVAGVKTNDTSNATITGNITTTNTAGHGIVAYGSSTINMTGNITTSARGADGIVSSGTNKVTFSGNISTAGTDAEAINITGGEVIMNNGTISAANAYQMYFYGGTIELNNVNTDTATSGSKLMHTKNEGILKATNSNLVGDILHDGGLTQYDPSKYGDTLTVNLMESTLTGSAYAETDNFAKIDVDLDKSIWNVTGNSITDGTLNVGTNSVVNMTADDRTNPLSTLSVENLEGIGTFIMDIDASQTNKSDKIIVADKFTGTHKITLQEISGNYVGQEAVGTVLASVKNNDGEFVADDYEGSLYWERYTLDKEVNSSTSYTDWYLDGVN